MSSRPVARVRFRNLIERSDSFIRQMGEIHSNSVVLDRIKKIKSYPLTLYIVPIVELEASNKMRALDARIAFRMPRETKFLSTFRLQRIEGNQPLFNDENACVPNVEISKKDLLFH